MLSASWIMASDYYISSTGNDSNSGTSVNSAWKTIEKLNTATLQSGDRVFFEGGKTFAGNIWLRSSGTAASPVRIGSYGTGRAVINAGNSYGIWADNSAGFIIENLIIKGAGSAANTREGILFWNTSVNNTRLGYVHIEHVEVSGFGKTGIYFGAASGAAGYEDVTITRCEVHDNGRNGIFTDSHLQYGYKNVKISHCKVFNNTGDRNEINTHTGSGIILGWTDGGLIEFCEAYNNGALNGWAVGGPVGIWCFASRNVIIQYNESHHNKAGLDKDGGGFDIDGGAVNCILQYNYSHDNDGAGYLLAQYVGADPFYNNTVRFNISENDGRKNSYGGIGLWGGSPFRDCYIYNNTVYTDDAVSNGTPSCLFMANTNYSGLKIFNNIFVSKGKAKLIDSPSQATASVIQFNGNCYFSADNNFTITWGGTDYFSLPAWRNTSGQEKTGSVNTGLQENPLLLDPGKGGTLADPLSLSSLSAYKVSPDSPVLNGGIDLTLPPYSLQPVSYDFWGIFIPAGQHNFSGAYKHALTVSVSGTEGEGRGFVIFPNPSEDGFRIKLNDRHNGIPISYTVSDMSGVERQKGIIPDISQKVSFLLPSGMYLLSLYKEGKLLGTKKIIIR